MEEMCEILTHILKQVSLLKSLKIKLTNGAEDETRDFLDMFIRSFKPTQSPLDILTIKTNGLTYEIFE